MVALRKNLSIERGDNVLFDEYRYFFYITNDRKLTADQVIGEAHQRCNQENLIANLKSGVRALHAPVNTLYANWAYMTMASLAWTLKAWCALMLPVSPRWEAQHEQQRCRLLTMEFRTFRAALIDIPLSDRQDSPLHTLAHPSLEPLAGHLLPPPRRPLTPSKTRAHPEPAHRLCVSHPKTSPPRHE